MAINQTFVDFVTPIPADWLNNVNVVVNNPASNPVSITQFGAVGDGVTDCTAAFNNAISTVVLAGGGIVTVPAGSWAVSGQINIPSRVTIRGVGVGENWLTGDGVSWGTVTPSFATRILWTGGYTNNSVFSFGVGVFDAGISDLMIDGQVSVTNIQAWATALNNSTTLPATLNGISSVSNLRLQIRRVSIQNVTYGVLMQTAPSENTGFGVFDTVMVMTCNIAMGMLGISTASIANMSWKDCAFIGYYNRGMDFKAWVDSNYADNIYFATTISPSVGIWMNSAVPGASNGVGFNNFLNVIMDLNQGTPTDTGMRSVICGYTAPGYNYFTGFIASTNFAPSLNPEIRPNGLFIWSQATAPSYTVNEIGLWTGGQKTGNVSSSYNYLDAGAVAFFNSNLWNSLYSTLALVTNFKPASKIVRVDWVTYWDPASTTGSIELINDGNGSLLSTPITPGVTGAQESMQDVTSFLLPLAGGAVPNYVTPNDFRLQIKTAGNGTTGPIIYKSFLRVITSSFV